jgi:hypothetical protein
MLQAAGHNIGISLGVVSAVAVFSFALIAITSNSLVMEAAVSTALRLEEKPRDFIFRKRERGLSYLAFSLLWFTVLSFSLALPDLGYTVDIFPLKFISHPALAVHYFCELKYLTFLNHIIRNFPVEKPVKELV